MALDIGTLVAKVKVDDSDFDQKTSGWSTKGGAIASAFGNLASNAISSATSMLVDFVGEAANASDATKKFKDTLAFAGLGEDVIGKLTKSTQSYADETVYSLGDIQSITAQLASNGVKDFDTLAMSLGNLNAVAGGNAETYGRVGMVLTQTSGIGKLTTENWNQLAEAIPGASGVIQDALLKNGAFTGNFREAMTEGQISAEEFNAALLQVGSDPIAVEAAKSVETFEGAQGNLAAAIQSQLVAALEVVKPAFTGLQNALAWFISNSGLLVPVITGIAVALLVVFAPAIWAAVVATAAWTVALLANPMTWIVLGIVALVAAIVWLIQNWDVAVAFITDIWGEFTRWLGEALNNIASWWNDVWSGISSFFTGLWQGIVDFAKGVWQFYIGWLVDIIIFFVQNWDSIWARVGQIIADVWGNIVSFFEGIPGAIGNLLAGAGTWLYNIGRDIIQGLWNGLKSIWTSVSNWFEDTFGGIIDTVAGIFGIASPSKVFYSYIAGNIGEGMLRGLQAYEDPIDAEFRKMMTVPPVSVGPGSQSTGVVGSSKTNIVQLTMPAGTTTEEAIFAALGSPRVGD